MDTVSQNTEITHQNTLVKFMNWAKKNGAVFPDIAFKIYGENERGVHSNSKIRKGANVIKIPLKMIIHDGMGEKTPIGRILANHHQNRINDYNIIMVVVFILSTIKKDSFYKPYYDLLPRDISNFPVFWSDKEYNLLAGSHILYKIRQRQKAFIEDYNTIIDVCPEFKQWSLKDFLWARTIVGSRNFGIDIGGVNRTAMVPLSDMLNHDEAPNVAWRFDNRDGFFKMKSNKTLKQGVAITDTYGKKCNSQYFLYYGFTQSNNNKNRIKINLVHPISSNKLYKDSILPSVSGYLCKDIDLLDFNELMVFLRISLSDNEMLKKYKYRSQYFYPLTTAHEILVLKSFRVYLDTLLSKYKFSYDALLFNLKKCKQLTKEWNALTLIKGEMEVILFYKDLIKQAINYINKKDNSFDSKYNTYFIKLRKLRNDYGD